MKLLRNVRDAVPLVVQRAAAVLSAVALAVVLFANGSSAFAQAALATTNIDVGEYVTLGITALAGVVTVVVGGFFAFLVIRKALSWGRRALA